LCIVNINTQMTVNKQPKRCQFRDCKKKLPLTKFMCKCGLYFCDFHRYPNEHNCSFDYRTESQNNEDLIKTMKCVSEKIEKV